MANREKFFTVFEQRGNVKKVLTLLEKMEKEERENGNKGNKIAQIHESLKRLGTVIPSRVFIT
jgi:hypothetical protein